MNETPAPRSRPRRLRRLACLVVAAFAFAPVGVAFARGEDQPRIVGGAPAAIEQYPWQAAVAVNDALVPGNGLDRQFCGATVVAPTFVVTAAHCVYDIYHEGVGFNAPRTFEVLTGRTTLSSSAGQAIEVAEVYYLVSGPGGAPTFEARGGPDLGPELYTSAAYRPPWDVALLRLAAPSASPPIQIAGADEAPTWRAGQPAYVSGWGDAPAGTRTDQLQAAEIAMLGDGECAQYGWDLAYVVCAGGNGRGTCFGDSGGPLVVPVEVGASLAARLVGAAGTADGDTCVGPAPNSFGRLAADPIRTAIQGVAGAGVVGSGARPYGPPRTKIAMHPRRRTSHRKARFKLSADEPASFECKLDRRRYMGCGPKPKLRVGRGRHKLRVRAIDALGQVDPTPERFRWKVRR